MPSNSSSGGQESGENNQNSRLSKITLDFKTIIIGIIIATIGTIIANYVTQEDLLNPYESYENSDYGIELKHPKKWTVQDQLDSWQPEVNFVSPLENDIDSFQERVSVTIEPLSQPLSIKEYATKATAEIEIANTIIEPAKVTNFANKEGRTITYQQKNGNKKRRQVWMIKNQQVYIATYTAEAGSFDKFAKQADRIIESINIE